ncbi:MAG: T9SS type A sorting domain-containing protein [Bacteroides sp.]|nr:T9SS type A sorting domain-containing protein [Bacteroides sp.]MCM1086293.1 T9SS type A sorting domain-containing protein [Bacteroides sp.]
MKKFLMSIAALFLGLSMVCAQGTYTKITSADELEEGAAYLVVNTEKSKAMSEMTSMRIPVVVTIADNAITTETGVSGKPFEVTLEKVGENWALYDAVAGKYVAHTNTDKNYLENSAEAYPWAISIAADGNATIATVTATVPRRLLYMVGTEGGATGDPRFSAYKSVTKTNLDVQLYKKEGEVGERVERPTFTPAAQTFESTISVTLACGTEGAKIYYSLTEEAPATEYTAPIELKATTTITAVAKKEGMADSYKATAKYTLASDLDINTIADLWTNTGYPDNIDESAEYTVKGKVVVTAKDVFNNRIWVQDMEEENGRSILIFKAADYGYSDLKVGDVIENLTGNLENYKGTLELKPTQKITASETGATPYVTDVTISELYAEPLKYQAALIRIEDVTFKQTGRFASDRGSNYTLLNGTDTITFRTDFQDANYLGGTIPTGAQKVTGICATFNGLPQITARNKKDMVSNVDPGVAVEDMARIQFSVYPNPTEDVLNVELAEGGVFGLNVYGLNGALLMSRQGLSDKAQVSLAGLAKGVYVVEIRTAEGTVRTKVVVR